MRTAPITLIKNLNQLKLETPDIFNACYDGPLDVVENLIENGFATVSDLDRQRDTPLHLAAFKGNAPIVKYLLTKKADLEAENESGQRPLHRAATNGCLEVVQILTEAGATLRVYDKNGMSPLHLAARRGSAVITSYLYKKCAIRDSPVAGKTPWELAMEEGHVGVVRVLGRDLARWVKVDPFTRKVNKFPDHNYIVLFKAGVTPGEFNCPRSIFLELGSFFLVWIPLTLFLR
jgi:hypothetical protein